MEALLKKLLSAASAAGPVGWISLVALAALAVAGYAIYQIATLATAILQPASNKSQAALLPHASQCQVNRDADLPTGQIGVLLVIPRAGDDVGGVWWVPVKEIPCVEGDRGMCHRGIISTERIGHSRING